MGRLPEQTQANLQMVAGLRQQQENTAMSLRSEQDRLAMLERQIEAMKGRRRRAGTTAKGRAATPRNGSSRSARSSTKRRRCTPTSTPRCSDSRASSRPPRLQARAETRARGRA